VRFSPGGRLSWTILALSLAACERRPARPNVLLISVDALRADSVGAYGYPRRTTPFLDSLAAQGRLFTKAYVPLPATAPSHATLLTSLHPAQHGVVSNTMALPEEAQTLAEVLKANGYVTLGAVAVFYLKSRYGFGQGFDAFSDEWNVRARGNTRERRSAADVNASVSSLLSSYAKQTSGRPLFLFVHYYDVHAPYVRRPRYLAPQPVLRSPTGGADEPTREMVESYDSGVQYVDDHIRQLYELLEKSGLARDLLVCVTSDHGEQLGEHGYKQGHADIYSETIRVPLLVHGAGEPRERVERPTSSMDVAVSLLDRLSLRFPGAAQPPAALGGALPWSEGAPRDRPFLVLGYPGHTESLALIQEDRWYIRNLDSLYREVLVETPAAGAATPQGLQQLPEASRLGGETQYVIEPPPSDGLASIEVTVEARLERPSCRGEIALALQKRRRYLEDPLRFEGAVRLRVPATSRDRISVTVTAASCRADVFYRVAPRSTFGRERVTLVPAFRAIETALWRKLPIPRKSREGDEIYDARADPGMLTNLIESGPGRETARRLDALIDRLWSAYARRALAAQPARAETAEEREALRSLGYVR
jgi:arylsulfatase